MRCRQLGDLCFFYRGSSIPRARMHERGDYLYIHYGDLYKGFELRIDVESPQKPIPYVLSNERIKDTQWLRDQDIVCVLTSETVADLGHSFIFNNPEALPAVAGTETTIVRVDRRDLILPSYLNYFMQTSQFKALLRQYVKGMKVFRVHPDDLARIEINLPSLDEQRKVVAFFDALFNKQLLNMHINDYLSEIMEACYRRLFSYSNQRYGSIYDIADVVYGAAFSSKLFNEEGTGWPLIRIRDLDTCSPQFFTGEAHPKRTFIYPGDVIAGMDADFKPTLWLGDTGVLNQRVCEFLPPENTAVTKSYLLCAMRPLLAYIQNYATGTTVAHLGKSDLEMLNVPLPEEKDLIHFGEICEPIRHAIVSNAREVKRLSSLRDCLLPKLMSGEIDASKVKLPVQPNNHLSQNVKPD